MEEKITFDEWPADDHPHYMVMWRACNGFVLDVVIPGQPPEKQLAAIQAVLDVSWFDATAMWCGSCEQYRCEGPDGLEAMAWLAEMVDSMPRGDVDYEVAHVATFVRKRIEERV